MKPWAKMKKSIQLRKLSKKYGDTLEELEKKWFLAAQEARTFPQAMQAVRDAVSSGWMNIFTNIFGAVADAKILWTQLSIELYDIFMDGIWKKIDILEIWADDGGRNDLFDRTEESTGAFWNLLDVVVAIKNLVGNAWQKVFGFSDLEGQEEIEDIANKLKNFTSQLKDWSAGVSKFFRDPSEEIEYINKQIEANGGIVNRYNEKQLELLLKRKQTLESFTNILTGLFSIFKIVGKTVIAVLKGLSPLIEVLKSALGYLLGALGLVGKEITQFSDTTDVFEKITKNLRVFLTTVIDFVKRFGIT